MSDEFGDNDGEQRFVEDGLILLVFVHYKGVQGRCKVRLQCYFSYIGKMTSITDWPEGRCECGKLYGYLKTIHFIDIISFIHFYRYYSVFK